MSTMIATVLDDAVTELTPLVGTKAACEAVGLARASYYRAHPAGDTTAGSTGRDTTTLAAAEPDTTALGGPAPHAERPRVEPKRQHQPRALSEAERTRVLAELHSERFADASPATVYATLLDDGTYLASESTMYRLLRERGETGDRRRRRRQGRPQRSAHRPHRRHPGHRRHRGPRRPLPRGQHRAGRARGQSRLAGPSSPTGGSDDPSPWTLDGPGRPIGRSRGSS
jgi:hypothetical protein